MAAAPAFVGASTDAWASVAARAPARDFWHCSTKDRVPRMGLVEIGNASSRGDALDGKDHRTPADQTPDMAPHERDPLLAAVEEARDEWRLALRYVRSLDDPELVRRAVYLVKAAERRYVALLRKVGTRHDGSGRASGSDGAAGGMAPGGRA